ncbi:MAG: PQQ-binding-like beta-propeller repeat protein [Planctomycetota bacterium]
MHRDRTLVAALAGLAVSFGSAAMAQDIHWPGFRGPDGGGTATSSHPSSWSAASEGGQNLAWSVDLPGIALASPIVIGDTVYVVTVISPELETATPWVNGTPPLSAVEEPADFRFVALDLESGEQLWETSVANEVPAIPTHTSNSFATESPVTDGKHLFAHFGCLGVVVAVDLEGNEVWRRDVGAYSYQQDFGPASSVVLADGVLVVHSDNQDSSFVMGIEPATGRELWKNERQTGTAWASPTVAANPAGGSQVIVPGSRNITSYDPKTGETIWQVTDIRGNFSASGIVADGKFIAGPLGRGQRGGMIAVELDAEGEFPVGADADESGIAYVVPAQGFAYSSPVVVGDRLYVARASIFAAHDTTTGELLYRERLPEPDMIVASLWTDGETVYAMNVNGTVFGVKAGDEFELVSTNTVSATEGEQFSGTPAVAQGALLIKGSDRLYCIRSRG